MDVQDDISFRRAAQGEALTDLQSVTVFADQEGAGSQVPTAASKTLTSLGAEMDPHHRPVTRGRFQPGRRARTSFQIIICQMEVPLSPFYLAKEEHQEVCF